MTTQTIMPQDAREKLIIAIHAALGGNGQAYSNYGYDELNLCREELEAVADILEKQAPPSISDRILAIESAIGGTPGTQLVRVLFEHGMGWTLTIGGFQQSWKRMFNGQTIQECISAAETSLLEENES